MAKEHKILLAAAIVGLVGGFIAAGATSATGIYAIGAQNGVEAGFGGQVANLYNAGVTAGGGNTATV